MATVRERLLKAAVADVATTALTEAGWLGDDTPFDVTPVTVTTEPPNARTPLASSNLVVITLGDPGPRTDAEMGVGFSVNAYKVVEVPVFLDVFGERGSIAEDLADDLIEYFELNPVHRIKDVRKPGEPFVDGQYFEIGDITGPGIPEQAAGATDFRKHWRVVGMFAVAHYQPLA